ncbi:rhodanese-like domain-containing protein [Marihabitans asiaticum]|uniref:Rhodanese-related sulfurtransferase n=1 Tax=Marihabitans asiaticum TaxID=415218 RepID=A0A560WCT1_9MICO|nr:rhodanese-like domain-containing protein [Marihabitans asiaticum]TWD15447.1 rhodanese-related sulfurtransferase [Marihabitans asiaticum]
MTITTTPRSLDAAALHELLDGAQAPVIVDVRAAPEFETAHIPGSVHIPLDLLQAHPERIVDALADDVVLVCRSGNRAAQASDTLERSHSGARVLDGGILAWEMAGGPLTRGRPAWELERQVRLVAGGIVLASVLASTVAPRAKWVAGAIGTGLTGAALTDTCAMGALLSRLPYNRRGAPEVEDVVERLAG